MPAISTTSATPTNELDLGPAPQPIWRDLQVLSKTWVPPTLVGRGEVLSRLHTPVLSGLTPGGRVAVSISGPRGSGTSAIMAHVVATAKARITRPGGRGVPLVLQVDASAHRTPSSLVTALFRELDPAFDGRGASTEFLTLLLLRRLRTLGRPAILVFDQVGTNADLSRVLRPLAQPERILPEGPSGLPTMLLVAAGACDPFPEGVQAVRTVLTPLQGHDLRQAIMTRAHLAFRAPPSLEAVEAIANLSVARGWGLSMVGELLAEAGRKAEARGGRWIEVEDVAMPANLPRHGREAEGFEATLLELLRGERGALSVGELRRQLAIRCGERGVAAPNQARLWRHLVVLERKGAVRREVRLGGAGGSQALVSLTV